MNRNFILTFAFLLSFAPVAGAQRIITTVAGGGPNKVPALQAGINAPHAVFKDSVGNLYVAAANGSGIYKIDTTGTLTRIVGNGSAGGYSGDGGPATNAELNDPYGVFVDSSGNIFIADSLNNRIRKVVASTGIIQTVAGNGSENHSGDGGPATSAGLYDPSGVFVDSSGNIFIADSLNNRIREVVSATGNIQTVAGNGAGNFSGDGGPATNAGLNDPSGVFVDSSGNIFIADAGNSRIRKVVASTGIIQTVAGIGPAGGYSGDGGPATSAELNGPYGVFVDSSGNISIADTGNSRIRKVVAATGIIQTVAGIGLGFSGDGGPATSAEFDEPLGVFVDSSGNIFIADSLNNRIREVVSATGNIQTVAGNGSAGYSGDGGPATSAGLYYPSGVFVDSSGNIFIAESLNNRIRKVVAATGIIQTVAGNDTAGFSGDAGPATNAELNGPYGLFVDFSGNIFIADTFNSRIRKVVAATGIIETVAGNGSDGYSGDGGPATNAELNDPYGVFVDSSGNIFIADSGNNRIREVVSATGNIQTVAGNGSAGYSGDGGPATSAGLYYPSGLFVDSSGNIFIADTFSSRIRKVVAATGIIQTVAGNDTFGFSGDAGPATNAELNGPQGVFVDSSGNIFIADSGNNRIREVVSPTGNIQTVAGNGAAGFSGDGGPATSAELSLPWGLFGDHQGNLFIADYANYRVRNVTGFVTGPTANVSASGGTPQSATVNTAFAAPLSATVTDSSGSVIAGVVVTFTAPAAGASGTFAGGVSTATTNTAGVATSAAFTANSVASPAGTNYTVTATIVGVAAPANFSLTNNPGPPASVTASSGTSQSTPINTAFATSLTVAVQDASGNPKPGVNVTFTAPANGASGTFAGGSATATVSTNAQGIATSPAFTANSTAGGPYNVTAAVAGVQGSATFSLTNQPPPLQITTPSLPSGEAGTAYSAGLVASGGVPPYSWLIASGSLPPGIALNSATGAISGTPSAAGASNFTVQVTDSETPPVAATAALSIAIAPQIMPLVITTTSLPSGQVGTPYSQTLTVMGGTGPYTWSLSSGTIPAGLALNAATGVLSGTPTVANTYTIVPQVSDSGNPRQMAMGSPITFTVASQTITQIQVLPNITQLSLSVAQGPSAVTSTQVFYALDSTGAYTPATWTINPPTGAGTIAVHDDRSVTYTAPAVAPPAGTMITLTATSTINPSMMASSQPFTLTSSNVLGACCVQPGVSLLVNTMPGGSGTVGAQLNGVPSTGPNSTIPFTLSCTNLPPGAACAFSFNNDPISSITGQKPKADCTISTSGPAATSSAGLVDLPFASRKYRFSSFGLCCLLAGITLLLRANGKEFGGRLTGQLGVAMCLIILIFTVGVLSSCGGFSASTVAPPPATVTPSGQYTVYILATPQSGNSGGFVQSQLLVPLNVAAAQ